MGIKSRRNYWIGKGISQEKWNDIFQKKYRAECIYCGNIELLNYNEKSCICKKCRKLNKKYKSICCNFDIEIKGKTTCYYICKKCREACDIK